MTTQTALKGQILVAQVQGQGTDWAVRLWVSSPTGDSSDSFQFDLPCLSLEQACDIADSYNKVYSPAFVGHFHEMYANEMGN